MIRPKQISIHIAEKSWRKITRLRPMIRKVVAVTLAAMKCEQVCLSILLTNDQHMSELNGRFRHKPYPTNILSFPALQQGKDGDILGEMALGYEIIVQQAHEQNKTFEDHLSHLLVHGVLHLLGYDHIDQMQADAMEAHEIAILAKLAISDPYIIRL